MFWDPGGQEESNGTPHLAVALTGCHPQGGVHSELSSAKIVHFFVFSVSVLPYTPCVPDTPCMPDMACMPDMYLAFLFL